MSFPGQSNGSGETSQTGADDDYFKSERLLVRAIGIWDDFDSGCAVDFVYLICTSSAD